MEQPRPTGNTGTTLLDTSSFLDHSPQLYLTVIEGSRVLLEVDLLSFGKQYVSFGASTQNDICFASSYGIVSSLHGSFLLQGGMCYIQDNGSTNGLYVNGLKTAATPFAPGDVATIGNIASRHYDSIMLLLSYEEATWRAVDLNSFNALSIGRAASNDLVLGTPSVSARHAALMRLDAQTWQVTDLNSFNGTYVAGSLLQGSRVLQRGDVIQIANATAVYTGDALVCGCANAGVEVEARDLVQVRRVRGGSRTTTDHVSLRIKRGEFVAILGGSGAGKSTLLNELNGTDPAVSGSVRVNGVDLYRNYGILKNGIGYVPQQDIVYDDLRLIDMLRYAADLRMTPDSTPQEREQRCYDILAQLELSPFADQYIRSLSGGQRKRASIAVEMLADPRLFFLDEPTSGLDPGIEKSLMKKLSSLARGGRTVVVVTHTTQSIDLCDRVVFMGAGGVLCFEGSPSEARAFFGVEDFTDVFGLIAQDPVGWANYFASRRQNSRGGSGALGAPASNTAPRPRRSPSFVSQALTLTRRYAHLVLNDHARLALLLLQAPLLGALICAVAGHDCFDVYESTKSCLFSLACASFWVGILNSVQEICKERTILKREYAGGMGLGAYLTSKVLVLGALCVLQSAMLTGVFVAFEGVPKYTLMNGPLELFITVLLITFSAMNLGLFVSALFTSADRAIAVAPILIMPQILFSGLVFELKGAAKSVSAFVNCRWGMEAFGTTARLNKLDFKIYRENDNITEQIYKHKWEAAYDFVLPHLLSSWGILVLFCIVSLAACAFVLKTRIRK